MDFMLLNLQITMPISYLLITYTAICAISVVPEIQHEPSWCPVWSEREVKVTGVCHDTGLCQGSVYTSACSVH